MAKKRTQQSKIAIKRSSLTGTRPTMGPSTNHVDGTWGATDIYLGELFFNIPDQRVWIGNVPEPLEIIITGGTAGATLTGGTFSNNTLTLNNQYNDTVVVTGFTDNYITGGTYTGTSIMLRMATGNTITITGITGNPNYCTTPLIVSGITDCSGDAIRLNSGLFTPNNTSSGYRAIAFGNGSTAEGDYSVTYGLNTYALGEHSHAEGVGSTSEGEYSHAEGDGCYSLGYASHAEGKGCIASGNTSHAEGFLTEARGDYSHAEGEETTSFGFACHVSGGQNINRGDYASIIGGTNNELTATADRSVILGGDGIIGMSADTVYATKLDIVTSIKVVDTTINGTTIIANNIYAIDNLSGDTITGSDINTDTIKFGAGNRIQFKEIAIGDWDMDTNGFVNVSLGTTSAQTLTIRQVCVMIYSDTNVTLPLDYSGNDAGLAGGSYTIINSTGVIQLQRVSSLVFDSVDFNATSFNRGYISFWYTA